MVSPEIQKYIEKILKKAYGKNKMSKYAKKIKKKGNKKNKKHALHSQFKLTDKLIEHNLLKFNLMPVKLYNNLRKNKLKKMSSHQVKKIWTKVNNNNTSDPYSKVSDVYKAIQSIDFIEKQKQAMDKYEKKPPPVNKPSLVSLDDIYD